VQLTLVVKLLRKLSISVLFIWVIVGLSLATLYPLTENIANLKTGTDSGNSESGISSESSQTSIDSGSSESGDISRISQLNTGYRSSQTGISSENSESVVDTEIPQTDTGSGNKYLVNNFNLNITSFTAEITNPQDRVTENGFYEIKTNPAANHKNVLQSGTFSHSQGTFTITDSLTFVPADNTKYHILIYTNYPEHDNRVDKDGYDYSS